MKTKTIQQTIRFNASELLMDSNKHQSLSGAKALIGEIASVIAVDFGRLYEL